MDKLIYNSGGFKGSYKNTKETVKKKKIAKNGHRPTNNHAVSGVSVQFPIFWTGFEENEFLPKPIILQQNQKLHACSVFVPVSVFECFQHGEEKGNKAASHTEQSCNSSRQSSGCFLPLSQIEKSVEDN